MCKLYVLCTSVHACIFLLFYFLSPYVVCFVVVVSIFYIWGFRFHYLPPLPRFERVKDDLCKVCSRSSFHRVIMRNSRAVDKKGRGEKSCCFIIFRFYSSLEIIQLFYDYCRDTGNDRKIPMFWNFNK